MDREKVGSRITWLSAAKGVGIAAVVAGHVTSSDAVHRFFFLFHMPMFFLLSGMTFRARPLPELLRSRTRSLLIPYVAWLALLTAIDLVMAHVQGRPTFLPLGSPVGALERLVFGGEALKGIYGIFWFVTCLFLAQIVVNVAVRHLGPPSLTPIWLGFFAVALAISYLVPKFVSPWNGLVVPMASLLCVAGMVYRARDAAETTPPWLTLCAAGIAVAAWLFLRPMDMKYADYGTPMLTLVAALCIAHVLCVLVARIHFPVLGSVLSSLGEASFVVMFLHLTIKYAFEPLVPEWVVMLLAIVIPWACWAGARRIPALANVFLGGRA